MERKKIIEKAVATIDFEAEKLIDQILKEFPSPSESQIKETRELLTHEINSFKEAFLRGYDLVLDDAFRGKFHVPKENFELKPVDKKKHPEFAHISATKVIKTKFLQEIFDYSPRMMREIYELGSHFFHQKEFLKCIDIFTFLTVLNPSICWFWQLIGRSWEEQNNFQKALYAYSVAINCDLLRLAGYQDAVRCCVKLKEHTAAKNILDYGLDVIKMDENSKDLQAFKSGLEAMKAYITRIGG